MKGRKFEVKRFVAKMEVVMISHVLVSNFIVVYSISFTVRFLLNLPLLPQVNSSYGSSFIVYHNMIISKQ